MEAQYAEAKGELVIELEGKTTTVTVRDFTPAGVRQEFNLQGEIKGRYSARHVETVTGLLKADGTAEYEAKGVDTTRDGDVVLLTGKGHARMDMSEGKIIVEGDSTFMTTSKKLDWLNKVKGRHEGTYDPVTGELSLKVYEKM